MSPPAALRVVKAVNELLPEEVAKEELPLEAALRVVKAMNELLPEEVAKE